MPKWARLMAESNHSITIITTVGSVFMPWVQLTMKARDERAFIVSALSPLRPDLVVVERRLVEDERKRVVDERLGLGTHVGGQSQQQLRKKGSKRREPKMGKLTKYFFILFLSEGRLLSVTSRIKCLCQKTGDTEGWPAQCPIYTEENKQVRFPAISEGGKNGRRRQETG